MADDQQPPGYYRDPLLQTPAPEGAAPRSPRKGRGGSARAQMLEEHSEIGGSPGSPTTGQPPKPGKDVTIRGDIRQEYVAAGRNAWWVNYAKSLDWAIDDITRDFGIDLYERMLLDPQVASSIAVLKTGILEDEISLTSPVRSQDDPGYEQAKELVDFCEKALSNLDYTTPLDDVLWDMLDAVAVGNRVAEAVYQTESTYTGKVQLIPQSIKTKPQQATSFVVDVYGSLIGLLALIPGIGWPVQAGMILPEPDRLPQILPREKFLVLSFRPKNNDPRGCALDPDTPIPTPDGWRKMDDLQPGDKVFDEQGRIRYVTARKDWEDRPAYRIHFKDGSEIIADENHGWPTRLLWERTARRPAKIRTTAQIARTVKDSGGCSNHAIAWAQPLDYPEQILPVHPYYLGLWLGDGNSANAGISCHAQDAVETVENIEACGYSAHVVPNGERGGNGRFIRVGGEGPWDSSGPSHALRLLGVIRNKHIPAVYLRGNRAQRMDLLSGLLDSDGHVDGDGRCEFTNTNRSLIDGVAELVRSLGITATVIRRARAGTAPGRSHLDRWSVTFTPPWSPFRLKRKAARTITERMQRYHYITSVAPVERRRTVCIEVDSPSHLYLAGPNMVPTHNSVLRPAYDSWFLKEQLKGEFMAYLARFATPSLIGNTDPNSVALPQVDSTGAVILDSQGNPIVTTPEQALLNSLLAFRNGTALVLPPEAKAEALSIPSDGTIFLSAFQHLDRQIAKAILSQTLATEEGMHRSGTDSRTHQDVLHTVIRHGKKAVKRMLRRDLLGLMVRLNYGDQALPLTPVPSLGDTESNDFATDATAIAALQSAGYIEPSQLPGVDSKLGLPPRDPATLSIQQAAHVAQHQQALALAKMDPAQAQAALVPRTGPKPPAGSPASAQQKKEDASSTKKSAA